MRQTIKVINAQSLQKQLERQGKAFAAESAKILKAVARGLAVDYGRVTDPPDYGGAEAVEGFKRRIGREIRFIFPTRAETGKVYELIKAKDPALAKAYYHAVKSKKQSMADRIQRQAGVTQGGGDPGLLKSKRTGKRASIPARKHEPVALLRASESRALARPFQNRAGMAKAGWHQAALAIGGRVRSNFTDADGRRSTPERFPAYVRSVSRRTGGLGGATVTEGRIVIYSEVRHASEAMPEARMRGAERETSERMLKYVKTMLSKLTEKFNRYKAA